MLKEINDTIEIQVVGRKLYNLYSLLEEKKCYKLEHWHLTSANSSEQHLWIKSPISPLILPNHFQVVKMRYCYWFCFLDVTDISKKNFVQILQNFEIYKWTLKLSPCKKLAKNGFCKIL